MLEADGVKINMNLIRNLALPSPETRWERGGCDYQDFELGDGRTVNAAIFDIGKVRLNEQSRDELRVDGRTIGYVATVASHIDNEAPRLNRVFKVDEKHAVNPNVYIGDGTALMTSIDGYAEARARELASERVSVVQRGEAWSDHGHGGFGSLAKRSLEATLHARHMSLLRSAQIEQATEAVVRQKYGLPNRSIQAGDSQPAIKMPGTVFAAEVLHDAQTVAVDIRAILCHEGFMLSDTVEGVKWILQQSMGAVGLIGSALVRRDLDSLNELIHTPDLDPAFLIGASLGSTPALLNGELGKTIELARRDIAGTQTVCTKDHLLRKTAKKIWSEFSSLHLDFQDETHLYVADREGRKPQVERLVRKVKLDAAGVDLANLTDEQRAYIYEKTPPVDQAA